MPLLANTSPHLLSMDLLQMILKTLWLILQLQVVEYLHLKTFLYLKTTIQKMDRCRTERHLHIRYRFHSS